MPAWRTLPRVKRSSGLRGTDWVLLAVLSSCAAMVAVTLAARAGMPERPPEGNIYESWQLTVAAPFALVGAYVVMRSPRHALGWLFVTAASLLWCTPLLSATSDRGWLREGSPARAVLFLGGGGWVWFRGLVLVLVPLAYPAGVLFRGRSAVRRASSAIAALVVFGAGLCNAMVFAALDFHAAEPFVVFGWAEPFADWQPRMLKALAIAALAAIADLLIRVWRLAVDERRRHLPVAAAATVLALPSLVSLVQDVGWLDGFDHPEIEFVAVMVMPAALAYGVLRHAALGFRTVLRRTVLYGGVTAVAAAIYVAVVAAFSAALQHGSGPGPVVATGAVAVSLQPVRAFVQKLADRWVFGDRDEPYRALAGLSQRLGDADVDPLASVAEVVRSSLRLASVTIEWDDAEGERVVAARARNGAAGAGETTVPIVFEGRTVAEMVVVRAEGAPPPGAAEERLLRDLAGAAGAVVQAALYADDLARSRGLIVRAREEERRRLRHDLHDGIGPTLASVAMGLDAAATRLEGDPDLSGLLRDLDRALQEAIVDIRRLVAGLRPPALDDLGLLPALREQALDLSTRSRRADGSALSIEVAVGPGLPPMAAAVEVAAYRIAVEAMTNVLRHADANRCHVRLAPVSDPVTPAVEVVVEDDGRGIGDDVAAGIGLESMRSRAEELGGRLRVGRRSGGGTVLAAWLPLHGDREFASA
jgi:signal transduction histidine kinase